MKFQVVTTVEILNGNMNVKVEGFPDDPKLALVVMDNAKKSVEGFFKRGENKIVLAAEMPKGLRLVKGNGELTKNT